MECRNKENHHTRRWATLSTGGKLLAVLAAGILAGVILGVLGILVRMIYLMRTGQFVD